MGKIVVSTNRGLKLWAMFALVTLSSLLASAFMDKPAFAVSSIMHNSSTIGNKYGSWGLDKGCTWCHSASQTKNVKKVLETINTPSGSRQVVFFRMTASFNNVSGVMGNDARTYNRSASTNVCEVCHHQTAFHQYSGEKVAAGHYDNEQCTTCHLHADGFKPSGHKVPYYAEIGGGHPTCSTAIGCHVNSNPAAPYPTAGTPPDCRSCHAKADPTNAANGCGSCHGVAGGTGEPAGTVHPDAAGSHVAHTAISGVTCTDCHTSGGTGGKTDHGMGNRGTNPAIVNLNNTFGWNGGNSTCATASCHVSPYGSAAIVSPSWGTSVGCPACHNASTMPFQANGAPATGSHDKHMAVSGTTCGRCHDGAVSGTSGGTNHLDGSISVSNGYPATAKHAVGTGYAGTCATASCHADPYGPGTVTSPVWGAAVGCAACHTGAGTFAANGAPATGSHAAHMAVVGTTCGNCHTGAVKGSSGGLSHANGTVEVANDYVGSPISKHAPGSYTGYCMSASCHASPYGAGPVNSPVWGTPTGCASCHTAEGRFTNTTSNGAPNTGSHAKHMALNNATCGKCHAGAVSGSNPGNHHADGFVNVTSGYTANPVLRHPIGTYGGTCANSCHTDGNGTSKSSPKWGVAMPANCTGCHGGAATVTPASAILNTGKHRSHMNNYSTLGKANNLKCAECHAKTVSLASNTVITNNANHVNGFKDFSGVKAGGSANYTTATGVCSNVYCHSSGQATPVYRNMTGSKAWGGTAKLDCNGCHGRVAGAAWDSGLGAPNYANHSTVSTANSHEKHVVINGMSDTRGCAKCHRNTVDMGVANKLRDYSSAHLNQQRDVAFSIFGSYSARTKSCTTYCHSNVQAPGGTGQATVYAKPAWGNDNGNMSCSSCHQNMATLSESPENLQLGSHRRHAVLNNTTGGKSGAGYSCAICHGTGYTAATVVGPTHADGTINVSFTDKGTGTTYSQAASNKAGDGYGTCSTSKCHGRANRSWGLNTTDSTCEKCHGSARTAFATGKFKDTAGSDSSVYSGTHASHLNGQHNITMPLSCNECHIVPASVDSFGHMSSLPAKIRWGVMATRSSIVRPKTAAKLAMQPFYNSVTRTCTNTYCHSGVMYYNTSTATYAPQGQKPAPSWNDAAFLGGTGCSTAPCHGYPPQGPRSTHTTSTNCNACHQHVDQSNLAFSNRTAGNNGVPLKAKHMNGKVDVTVDNCLDCHSSYNTCAQGDETCVNKKLVGGHLTHTNSELFLAGKSLSKGDYIDTTWIYGITYKKGFPQYACGFCHPMDIAKHRNGIVEIDLDPTHALRGSVKTKNKAGGPWLVTYIPNTSVVCNNIYCHSSGFVSETTQQYQFKQTPDWYYADTHGGTSYWANVDRCAQCHGNSPNTGGSEGSSAHARHVVGNHYKDVFDSYSGKLKPAGAPDTGSVHGDPDTATTLNCNVCHFDTVRASFNDKGNACASCHNTIVKGNMMVYSASTKHVNGDVDVVFIEPFNFKSKAQIRNSLSSVQSVYTSWTRVKGYKTYSSYDLARHKPQYVGGTCSTASCHNNTQMEWRTKGPLACAACHVGLPQ